MNNLVVHREKNLSLKYIIEQFSKGHRDWKWYYFQFTNQILPKYYSSKSNNGIYVWKYKWDNLIILDACRYDFFQNMMEPCEILGKLEKRISRGSSTYDFLLENFSRGNFSDIVYVTGNPYVDYLVKNAFYKTVSVWKDSWDEVLGTVLPDQIVKSAIKSKLTWPSKRVIVHFMQPHSPFVGSYRKEGNFWQIALEEGLNEAVKAYKSNLEYVLPYVKRLLRVLPGVTVVTSDHGEAMGERATPLRIPIYGHPKCVRISPLIEVPWLITKNTNVEY